MKRYIAEVEVHGSFTVVREVTAKSARDAVRKLAKGQGQNVGDSFDWDTWSEETAVVVSRPAMTNECRN